MHTTKCSSVALPTRPFPATGARGEVSVCINCSVYRHGSEVFNCKMNGSLHERRFAFSWCLWFIGLLATGLENLTIAASPSSQCTAGAGGSRTGGEAAAAAATSAGGDEGDEGDEGGDEAGVQGGGEEGGKGKGVAVECGAGEGSEGVESLLPIVFLSIFIDSRGVYGGQILKFVTQLALLDYPKSRIVVALFNKYV